MNLTVRPLVDIVWLKVEKRRVPGGEEFHILLYITCRYMLKSALLKLPHGHLFIELKYPSIKAS